MEFDDPQVFDDPKGISIESMDFDNPNVYGDTSILDGLVAFYLAALHLPLVLASSLTDWVTKMTMMTNGH